MTNKSLSSLIIKLNRNKNQEGFYLIPLSEKVDFGKVWLSIPTKQDNVLHPNGPFNFYFIKNKDEKYIGVVLDMVTDLHWFVLKKFRRQGHLLMALNQTILPHLFLDRKEQKITIKELSMEPKDFAASKKVALTVGFKNVTRDEYVIYKNDVPEISAIFNKKFALTEQRMEDIKKQINFIGRSLWLIQTEIESKFVNNEYSNKLKKMSEDILDETYKFEDEYWIEKNKK